MNGLLSTLDAVCWIMDRTVRPLDFTVILHAPAMPPAERLQAGARSARDRYPVTRSTTDGRHWIPLGEPAPEIETATAPLALGAFVDRPFDLRLHPPVRQLLINDTAHAVLATRFHHAAADGASAAMWLTQQLRAVHEGAPASFADLRLRDGRAMRRPERPSSAMWRRPAPATRSRRWNTIEFSRTALRASSGFTYNDILTTITLEVLVRWNRMHGADDRRIGLWLPINIRRAGSSGFGNGTSRIRVHANFPDNSSFVEKCRRIHAEISHAMRRREWAIPIDPPLTYLPRWLIVPALRSYLGRPWTDVGTATFSHLDASDANPRAFFDRAERIECVGPLHARHCLTIAGVSYGTRTWLTFAYDPAQLTGADVEALTAMYLDQIALAGKELSCAV